MKQRILRSAAGGIFIITLVCTLITTSSWAQTYWGTTGRGGLYDAGTIFTMEQNGAFTKKHDFFRVEGGTPKTNMLKASNGKFYGVTEQGGSNGFGTIFEYDAATGAYTTLYNMTIAGGTNPIRGVSQAANGKLYGLCSGGGSNNFGTLFEFNTATSSYIVRYHFNNTNGRTPRSGLFRAASGIFYGVTQLGGTGGRGVLFQFNPSNNQFAKLHDFTLPTGGQPFSGPVQAPNGRLYGATQIGGSSSGGVIYEYNITTTTYTVIENLDATKGRFPLGEMIVASNGLLYGATSSGGTGNAGTIYSIAPGTNIFTKRADLSNTMGASPFGRMFQASNGLLYGMTDQGGNNDEGVIYSFNTTTNVYTKVADLSDMGLSSAWGDLAEATNGTLIGACSQGGSGASGAVLSFNFNTSSLQEEVAIGFKEGDQPKGKLTMFTDGKFYGLTSAGGANDQGIIFSIDPNTDLFTRLADLGGTLGAFPQGSFVESGGKLYGLCSEGGTFIGGTIIEYDPNTNTVTKKKDLDANTGSRPLSSFIEAGNGKLYTMMSLGGVSSLGALVEYDPNTNVVTRRKDLTVMDGTLPKGDLLEASNGRLYGTCSEDGSFDGGTLFEYDPTTTSFTVLYHYEDIFEGSTPVGGLMQASDGKLYGITSDGAAFFNGSIFSWNISTSTFTLEYDMESEDGRASESSLIEGTDNRLYGTATQGGVSDLGTIFRFNPPSQTLAVMKEFVNSTEGQFPFDGLALGASSATVDLNIKVFLEGPYDDGTSLMNDDLRSIPQFPLTEPYTGAGFTHAGEGGGESIAASVLAVSGNDAIVDWVMVELRDKNNSATVVNTRSALLQRDGDIVDLDGTSALGMSVADDDYFVSVRHRNHLGVMTASTVALSTASSSSVDFTDGSTTTFGTAAQKVDGSALVNWMGNVVVDGKLQYTGAGNDRDPILVQVGGSVPTAVFNGYEAEDCTMNGQVKYTGPGNDRDPILVNVGGSVPTNTRTEQLP